MTKSYPDRIADVLLKAPSAPPICRKSYMREPNISDLTKTKLLVFHTIQATFGGSTSVTQHHNV